VKTPIDQRFLEEATRYQLCFTCEACAHFSIESGGCANGYPNAAHRSAPLHEARELEFCKEFELV
jgi:hypothetical protein